jgi:hypothetical protein
VQANGDNNAYWRVLSDAGITRQRLESFDRPVRCEPEWFGSGKKDVLIREFRNYLGILKAVHSGEHWRAASRDGWLCSQQRRISLSCISLWALGIYNSQSSTTQAGLLPVLGGHCKQWSVKAAAMRALCCLV